MGRKINPCTALRQAVSILVDVCVTEVNMSIPKWLDEKIPYLQGLKQRSEDQETLLRLALKTDRTDREERALQAAIRVERSADRYRKARVESRKVRSQTKSAEKKSRDREMFNSAGLLIIAGLVDTQTGKPVHGADTLLGGLLLLKKAMTDDNLPGYAEMGRERLRDEEKTKAAAAAAKRAAQDGAERRPTPTAAETHDNPAQAVQSLPERPQDGEAPIHFTQT